MFWQTMKEAYAVRRTVPPSAEIQVEIDKLLGRGMVEDPQKMLGELARLGAWLIIQRAVEDECDEWLGRARDERRPERQRGLRNYDSGLRNGFRARHVQTGEGELRIEVPQARGSVVPFVSKLFPKRHCKRLLRTDPLKALVIGGFVRGLSMRDVESLCEEAGLGTTSRSTIARICAELHERFEAFSRRSLYDVKLVVLFLDAIYLPVRPSGPKEGVVCAWGIDEDGARQLVPVRLGAREGKGGLGRARPRSHRSRTRRPAPGGRRRRARADQRGRRDLATRGPSALCRSPLAEPAGEGTQGRARPDPVWSSPASVDRGALASQA